MRALGWVTATALILAGIIQAVTNDYTVNGLTVLLCGAGLLVALLAWVSDVADEELSARLSLVDQELDKEGL